MIAAVAGAALWRWTPPRARTMNDVRTVVLSREMADQPQPPAGATPGRPLTKAQKASVEALTKSRLRRVLTPKEYAWVVDHAQMPGLIASILSQTVANAHSFPIIWRSMGAGGQLGDLQFVHRNPNGSLVVRVVHWDHTLWSGSLGSAFTQEYTLQKVGGSWRIAAQRDLALWPDGTLSGDLGG